MSTGKESINKDIEDYDKLFSTESAEEIDLSFTPVGAKDKKTYEGARAQEANIFGTEFESETPIGLTKDVIRGGRSDYDYLLTPYDTDPTAINELRAINQPWYDQAGAFLNQAIIGEVVGGTMMNLGALFDNPQQLVTGVSDDADQNFSNILFDAGSEVVDWAKNTAPIYSGERFDSGWFFQGGVSVLSSVAPMIIGGAVGAGFKALGALSGMSATAAGLLGTGTGAAVSRHAEGFREAADIKKSTYTDAYMDAMKRGLSEQDASTFAEEHSNKMAATAYNLDRINIVFDVLQMGAIFRPLRNLSRTNSGILDYKLAKASGLLPESKIGKTGYWFASKAAGVEVSEAFEEGVNTFAQFEAKRQSDIALGKIKEDGSTRMERIGEYLKTAEMQDSMIWGLFGGVAFKGIMKAAGLDQSGEIIKSKIKEITSRQATITAYSDQLKEVMGGEKVVDSKTGKVVRDYSNLTDLEKKEELKRVKTNMAVDLGVTMARAGNVDIGEQWMKLPETKKLLVEQGISTDETADQDISDVLKYIKKGEKLYNQATSHVRSNEIDKSLNDFFVADYVNYGNQKIAVEEKLQELKISVQEAKKEDTQFNKIANKQGVDVAEAVARKLALRKAKAKLEQLKEYSKTNKDKNALRGVESAIKEVNTELASETMQAVDERLGLTLSSELTNNIADEFISEQLVDHYATMMAETAVSEDSINSAKERKEDIINTIKEAVENNKTGEAKTADTKAKEAQAGRTVQQPETPIAEEIQVEDNEPIEPVIEQPVAESAKGTPGQQIEPTKEDGTSIDNPSLDSIFNQEEADTLGFPAPVRVTEIPLPKNTGTSLAYVGVEKGSTTINPNMRNQELMSTKTFQEGTKVYLDIDYTESRTAREGYTPISQEEIDTLRSKLQNKETNLTEREQEIFDNVAIGIYDEGGNLLSHIHRPDWITDANTSNEFDNIRTQRQANRQLRDHVLRSTGKVSTTIERKFTGHLQRRQGETNAEKFKSSSEVFGNNVLFGVVKGGKVYTSNDNVISGAHVGQHIPNGFTVAVVPSGSGQLIALPLANTKVQSKYVDFMMKVLEAYDMLAVRKIQDDNLRKFADEVKDFFAKNGETVDLTTAESTEGITRILNKFIYITYRQDMSMQNLLQEKSLAYEASLRDPNKSLIDSKKVYIDVDIKGIQLYTAATILKGVNGTYKAPVTIGNFGPGTSFAENKEQLREMLSNMLATSNLSVIGQKNLAIPMLDENGNITRDESINSGYELVKQNTLTNILPFDIQTSAGTERIYFVNPLIKLNTKFLEDRNDNKPVDTTPKGMTENTGTADDLFFPSPAEQGGVLNAEQLNEILKGEQVLLKGDSASFSALVTALEVRIIEKLKSGRYRNIDDVVNSVYKDWIADAERVKDARFVNLLSDKYSQDVIATKAIMSLSASGIIKLNKRAKKSLEIRTEALETEFAEIKQEEHENENIDLVGEEDRGNRWTDKAAFKLDPRTMSSDLKIFFKHIRNDARFGDNKIIGVLGYYEPIDVVLSVVQQLCAGTPKNIDSVIAILKSKQDSFGWMENLISSLESAPKQIKKQFVKFATLAPAVYDVVEISTEEKENNDGGIDTNKTNRSYNAARNTKKNIAEELWLARQKTMGWYRELEGEPVLSTQLAKEWLGVYEATIDLLNKHKMHYNSSSKSYSHTTEAIDNFLKFITSPESNIDSILHEYISKDYPKYAMAGVSLREYVSDVLRKQLDVFAAKDPKNFPADRVKNIKTQLDNILVSETFEKFADIMKDDPRRYVRILIEGLGISLPLGAWQELLNGQVQIGRNKNDVLTLNNITSPGVFLDFIKQTILENVERGENGSYYNKAVPEGAHVTLNPLGSNKTMSVLKKLAAKHMDLVGSSSTRNGKGHLLQGAITNTPMDLMIGEIKQGLEDQNNPTGIITDLMQNTLTKVDYTKTETGELVVNNSNSLWLEMLLTKPGMVSNFSWTWASELINKESRKLNKDIDELSPRELEIFKYTTFFNNDAYSSLDSKDYTKTDYIAKYFFPASERSRVPLISALRINLQKSRDRKIADTDLKHLVQIFIAEADRINKTADLKASGNERLKLKPELSEGGSKFFMNPMFNKSEDDGGDVKHSRIWDGDRIVLNEETLNYVKEELRKDIEARIQNKINKWKSMGIIDERGVPIQFSNKLKKRIGKEIGGDYTNSLVAYWLAAEYVFNYRIANANMTMLFNEDPANFHKKNVETTLQAYNKRTSRLTATLSPQIVDAPSETVSMLFITDEKSPGDSQLVSELSGYRDFSKDKLKNYSGPEITKTDAAVYVTNMEYIRLLYQEGKLSEKKFNELRKKIQNDEELTLEDSAFFTSIEKPIMVSRQFNPDLGMFESIHEKCAVMRLDKSITKNKKSLDNIRKLMEGRGENGELIDAPEFEKGNRINHVVHITASKVPLLKGANVYAMNGEINHETIASHIFHARRSDYGIQQEMNVDMEKDETIKASQPSQNIYVDVFSGTVNVGGRKLDAEKAKAEYEKLNVQLYKLQMDKFLEDIKYDESTGNYDRQRLADMITDQILNENNSNDLREALQIFRDEIGREQFKYPLWSLGFSKQAEAIMASLISNNITKLHMPGTSAALATPKVGDLITSLDMLDKEDADNIIWLDPNRSARELRPSLKEASDMDTTPDELLISQVIMVDGKRIDLLKEGYVKKATNGVMYLDTDKIDPKVLEGFGFRIPNQSRASSSYFKIVGFLPYNMQNMVVAPKEFIVRMGSDFDIDKLYMYMYATSMTEGGKIVRYNGEDQITLIKNKLIDHYVGVMRMPNKYVRKSIYNPNSAGRYSDLSDMLGDILDEADKSADYLSDDYHSKIFLDNQAAGGAIGNFALDSVLHAMSQNKKISIGYTNPKGDRKTKGINFGHSQEDNDGQLRLSSRTLGKMLVNKAERLEKTKDGKIIVVEDTEETNISEQIGDSISLAVDDFKNGFMGKLNMEASILSVHSAMQLYGFRPDYAVLLTNQPIVREFLRTLREETDTIGDKGRKVSEKEILKKLLDKYASKAQKGPDGQKQSFGKTYIDEYNKEMFGIEDEKSSAYYQMTLQQMLDMIQKKEAYGPNYYELQAKALMKFLHIKGIGDEIFNLKTALNTYSKHIPASTAYVITKNEQIKNVLSEESINNASSLFYDVVDGVQVPSTIAGAAVEYGLNTFNKLFLPETLYSKPLFTNILEAVESSTNKKNIKENPKQLQQIERFFRSFINSVGLTQIYGGVDPQQLRLSFSQDIFETIDGQKIYSNKSLATLLQQLKENPKFKDNFFVQILIPVPSMQSGDHAYIKFDNAAAKNLDSDYIKNSILDLLRSNDLIEANYTTQSFVIDLVRYALLSGHKAQAISYMEFMPTSLLTQLGVDRELRNLDILNIEDESLAIKIAEQYIQHHPEEAQYLNKTVRQSKTMHSRVSVNNQLTAFKLSAPESLESYGDNAAYGLFTTKEVEGKQVVVPAHEYLTYKTGKVVHLYKLVPSGVSSDIMYQRIPTLGTPYMGEAQRVSGTATSIFKHNTVSFKQIERAENTTSRRMAAFLSGAINSISWNPDIREGENFLYAYRMEKHPAYNKNETRDIVKNMAILTPSSEVKAVATFMNSVLLNLKGDLTLLVSPNQKGDTYHENIKNKAIETLAVDSSGKKDLSRLDANFYSTKGLINFSRAFLTDENNKLSEESISRIFLHEVVHAVTTSQIYSYFNKSGQLTQREKQAIQSLQSARDRYEKMLKEGKLIEFNPRLTPENLELMRGLNARVKKGEILNNEEGDFYNEYLPYFYSMIQTSEAQNLAEFVAVVMTDKNIQDLFNKIPATQTKSLLQWIVNTIKQMLEYMSSTMNITKDSMLEEAITSVIVLTNPSVVEIVESKNNIEEETEIEPVTEQEEDIPYTEDYQIDDEYLQNKSDYDQDNNIESEGVLDNYFAPSRINNINFEIDKEFNKFVNSLPKTC